MSVTVYNIKFAHGAMARPWLFRVEHSKRLRAVLLRVTLGWKENASRGKGPGVGSEMLTLTAHGDDCFTDDWFR